MSSKEIIDNGLRFYNTLKNDDNSRFKSWEYCYLEFNKAHNDKKIDDERIDYLCLQLSFYLASWGMYRGSSFLLSKDYKIHKPVIEIILDKEYDSLWGIEVNKYKDTNIQGKLVDIVDKLNTYYKKVRMSVKNSECKSDISDTLISKILLGTLGCVPAYDRFFIIGVRNEKVASGGFSINSILSIVDFYNKNYEELEKARSKMKVSNIEYPQMKLIDSCFWQIGYDKENDD